MPDGTDCHVQHGYGRPGQRHVALLLALLPLVAGPLEFPRPLRLMRTRMTAPASLARAEVGVAEPQTPNRQG